MQKRQLNLQLDAEVIGKLSKIGERFGLSANAILAASAYELARVRPDDLWKSLARITNGDPVELVPPEAQQLPAPRRAQRVALPVDVTSR